VVGRWIRNRGVIYDGARDSPEPASAGGEHNSQVNSAMRGMKQLATNFSIPLQAGHALCLFGVILWATYIQPFPLSRCHAVRPIGCADIANLPCGHLPTLATLPRLAKLAISLRRTVRLYVSIPYRWSMVCCSKVKRAAHRLIICGRCYKEEHAGVPDIRQRG
jgi:hypothetical protein